MSSDIKHIKEWKKELGTERLFTIVQIKELTNEVVWVIRNSDGQQFMQYSPVIYRDWENMQVVTFYEDFRTVKIENHEVELFVNISEIEINLIALDDKEN